MRFLAIAASTFALSTPVIAQSSNDLGAISASGAALYSQLKTKNPTAVLSSVDSAATAALQSLSALAATATGDYGSSLRSEYSSLKGQLSTAQKSASKALATNTGSGSGPTSAAVAGDSSAGFAPATAVPIAAVGVGMAVLGLL